MRIPTLERYLARQIYGAVGFVLLGFLALFAFFDLIAELRDLGNGNYQLRADLHSWSRCGYRGTPTSCSRSRC